MTEERFETERSGAPDHAIRIVQILIGLGYPKDLSELSEWLNKVKLLQTLLQHYWLNDPTGKVTGRCLNLLYNVIAISSSQVGPAVWSILDLVAEDKISEFVEGILSNPNTNDNTKVQNVLTAIIDGLWTMHGPCTRRLQNWVFALVQGLEAREKFTVLNKVAENVICKLMESLMIPLYRPYIYPIFRQFLYPVVTPQVFYKILKKVPAAINILVKDINFEESRIIYFDFAALIRVLMTRFPAKPFLEPKYNLIRLALVKAPESTFDPKSMILWEYDSDKSSLDSTVQPLVFKYDDISPQPLYKGLYNLGNTCFMNSVLQILFMTTRFRQEILYKEVDSSDRAACDLQQLFALMQGSKRSALVPSGVMESTLPPTFRRGHQQDSSEYLIYLLEILHENENKIIRRKKQSGLFDNDQEKKEEGNGDFERAALMQNLDEDTVVERLFGGETMSTTICSFCEKSFSKNDYFRDLHLPLPDDYKSCDLQELLDASLQPEELCGDNMYECDNCGTKRNATIKHTIVKAPQHLILTLKLFRFDPVRKQRLKLHSRLRNANSIKLSVYDASQLQTQTVTYDLKCVILHAGSSLDGGHYFSSAVDQKGQWYIFNDSVVTLARHEWSSNGGSPYILILRRSDIDDPPLGPLPSNLQALVNRDNQKFLTEKKFQPRTFLKKKDFKDDWDDPPSSGSLGGPSSLVC